MNKLLILLAISSAFLFSPPVSALTDGESLSVIKILMPLPDKDFDPTEVAIPWKILSDHGLEVVFATAEGRKPDCDPRMLSGKGLGPFGLFLRARDDARNAYAGLQKSYAFQHPLKWSDVNPEHFQGLILTGGHAKGMRQILESNVVQNIALNFLNQQKPVGAICHGVVILARTKDKSGDSVLRNRHATALLESQELGAWRLTRMFAGDYYRTYPETVEDEVRHAVGTDRNFQTTATPILRDSIGRLDRGFTVRDGNLLTARWPGDAYGFALRFLEMARENARF